MCRFSFKGLTCHRREHLLRLFCLFLMRQSKIISSTDAMFAIADAGILQHGTALYRMYRVTSITTLKPDGGTGDNVWYGRTNCVRIRSYESTYRKQ